MSVGTHSLVDEKVLRLEIAVKNSVLMTERRSLEKLEHEASHCHRIESALLAMNVHVLFQILLHEFEDEEQARLCMNNIVQTNDVAVPELLHE